MAKKPRSKSKSGRKTPPPPKAKPPARSGRRILGIVLVIVAAVVVGYIGWVKLRGSRGGFEGELTSGSAAGYNVVLVTLDTTRADHLGCYGYEAAETPVLDRLAREGVQFMDAVSTVPVTLPAHASILTGLDPFHHGVRNNGEYRLDPAKVTLAELLEEQGYDTAAFVSGFVLDARYGANQGFAHYDDRTVPKPGANFGGYGNERSASEVTDAALNWLHARQSDRPLFFWIHYYDPHHPHTPPASYAVKFGGNPYDGEVAFMDAQLGRFLDGLRELGLLDRTLVLVVGDHGESLGEHQENTHSRLIYDATQVVPLILWSPDLIRQPYVVDDVVVSITDLFPTVLDLLGIDPGEPTDGISLLECRRHPDRMVYMETMVTYLVNGWAPLHGLRRHTDKYILAPTPEYYDLAADPKELNNLYASQEPSVREAVSELSPILTEMLAESPSADDVVGAAVELDPEEKERLESLGYLSGLRSDADEVGRRDPKEMMPAWSLLQAGRGKRESGHMDEALALLERALALSPNDRGIMREMGITYVLMGREEPAEALFRKCIEIKPNVNVLLLLGQIMIKSKRFDEAEVMLRQASELEPEHGGILIARGDMALAHREYDEAMRLYLRAKQVDPYRATAMANQRIGNLQRHRSR